jgi:release factor glutamine methyltransferase
MTVIPAVAALAGRWLCPGGLLAVEHDDSTSAQTVDLLYRTELFEDIFAHRDLTDRPRFVTARRRSR